VIVSSDADPNTPDLNARGALVVCDLVQFSMDREVDDEP